MASSFQRQALQRKLIYAALILLLFTAALVWRREEFRVFGYDIKGVEAQARDLSIREQSRGEVDLISSAVRLVTMGLRGVATCWTMTNAMEAQKKNQWNQLELHVRTLVKLQPHFITPWIFQSWNLSYNVSVESDRVSDKYFYITRGICLLAEGERQNRDNPDMRWSIGFFLQHKIGQSDDTNVLRSMSQLSMIPPNDRDPGRFWITSGGRQEINYKELEDFCKDHPQLTRRLREGMRRERRMDQMRQFRCLRPEELVQFLEDNFRVPSLYVDTLKSEPGTWKQKQDKYKQPTTDRFPVLPPKHDQRPKQQPPENSALTEDKQLLDEHDVYQVSHAWFCYAQEPLPKPDKLPGQSEPIEDRVQQRLPKYMATVIFRAYPGQAQRFSAERLQEEGWFDGSGWTITEWFRDVGDRFANGEPPVVGAGRPKGLEAWQRTKEIWETFGNANHLRLSPQEEKTKTDQANAFARKYNLNEVSAIPGLREANLDAETREQMFAWQFMRNLRQYAQMCNFNFHYNRALVESELDTLRCRMTFFEAGDALRLRNDELAALQKYQSPTGMIAWRDKVLMTNKVFREDSLIQEYTFEIQLRYTDLYSRLSGSPFKAQAAGLLLPPLQTPPGAGACPVGLALWVPPLIEKDWDNPLLGGPFDVNDDKGVPLISEHSRTQLLQRLFPATFNLQPPAAPPQQLGPSTPNPNPE
jgi:hypothetical protein